MRCLPLAEDAKEGYAFTMTAHKRLGILTSGGDAPGLNAAIRAIARTAMNRYGMEIIGIEQGYRGLIENKYRILTERELSGILARGGAILGASREKPFRDKDWRKADGSGAVGSIKRNYKALRLDCLAVLGGNGSQTTANMLAEEGLNIIGIPKTIDNDIVRNDMSFGFHTALDVATDAVDRLHSTAASHNRVMVIEIMGHKAGWLTLYAGIAGGCDVIIIPEIPYRIESIAAHLQERSNKGKDFSIVAVAEGARSFDEKEMDKKALKEVRKAMIGSISYRIAKEIEAAAGLDTRVTVLGHLQRGGIPSGYDRLLATRFGAAAAEFANAEHYGIMTALKRGVIHPVPLRKIADKVKKVPAHHPMIIAARNVGTCLGD